MLQIDYVCQKKKSSAPALPLSISQPINNQSDGESSDELTVPITVLSLNMNTDTKYALLCIYWCFDKCCNVCDYKRDVGYKF